MSTLNELVRDDYQTLYNEFNPKWHFFPFGGVGTYFFYLCNGVFEFGVRKSDKRECSGYRLHHLFTTDKPEEMRKYLQDNEPTTAKIFNTKVGTFDLNGKRVRLNGKVLDKFSLCAAMERLDFRTFQYATIYTYDINNYETIKGRLQDYLMKH